MRRVVRQGADRGRPRRRRRRAAVDERRRIQPGDQSRRRRFHVALDAGHLPREEQRRPPPHLPRLRQHLRPVHVRVAVHHAEADELGLLQSWNQPEDACLLAPFELRLESHQAVVIAGEVVLAQLHDGVRRDARFADRSGRRVSSARTAASRRRDGPSLQSAGSLRRTARCRNRGRWPTRRARGRRKTSRTRRGSSGNSNSRPARRRHRRPGPAAQPGHHGVVGRRTSAIDRVAAPVGSVRLQPDLASAPARGRTRLRFHRDARNTLPRSIVSASTIGLMAS